MITIEQAQDLTFFQNTGRTVTRLRMNPQQDEITIHFSSDIEEEKYYKLLLKLPSRTWALGKHGLSGNAERLSDLDYFYLNFQLAEAA